MVSDPSIWMNGLYPGPATAPGWNLASGDSSEDTEIHVLFLFSLLIPAFRQLRTRTLA